MGGQTALNTALSLKRMGVLDRYNVEMIGAKPAAIDMAEDRALFREAMARIGLETPRSMLANATDIKDADRKMHEAERTKLRESLSGAALDTALDDLENQWNLGESDRKQRYLNHAMAIAAQALDDVGLPAIIRPSFTLGGTGGGIAYNRSEFFDIVGGGLDASPTTEVLIEESVLGWKEYEMEVVRDKADNCIIICSIENIDPMGVHTGDSITVAPALTLTDKEYQIMRNASIAVLREIGVETGGSNVQFAVNPKDGRLVVIEMNPRVSRSSALASKATGFPSPRSRRNSRSATRWTNWKTTSPVAPHPPPSNRRSTMSSPRFRALPSRSPGRLADLDDGDEVRRRSHGDRPYLRRIAAEGAPRPRNGLDWP
ncbi:hypothetical protein AJ87_31685 [Rhizobium yanglingense]|nr:hypothetical protein AJ87_31685 [Rhizobium yanglingense]